MVPDAVQRMLAVIGAPNAKDDEHEMATDNAVSALGKILEFHGEAVDAAAVAGAWLGALPLTADAVEGVVQHELLVRLLEAQDPRVLGPVSSAVLGLGWGWGCWGAGAAGEWADWQGRCGGRLQGQKDTLPSVHAHAPGCGA